MDFWALGVTGVGYFYWLGMLAAYPTPISLVCATLMACAFAYFLRRYADYRENCAIMQESVDEEKDEE